MASSIYITSAEGNTGKSTVALGLLDTLLHSIERVGVFRPIARSATERDYVLEMLLRHDGVDLAYDDCVGVEYQEVSDDPETAMARIVERYRAVEARCDAVVIVGSDYTDVGSPTELGFNARIAANLGAPVLLVLGGRVGPGLGMQLGQAEARTPEAIAQIAELAQLELRIDHATLLGVVVNRAAPEQLDDIIQTIGARLPETVPVWAIPEDPYLVAPTMGSILEAIDGDLVRGDTELLSREALGVVITAMSMNNILAHLEEGAVVVIPADRTEALMAVMLANASDTFPSIAGVVLNGGFEIPDEVRRLIDGLHSPLPIIRTDLSSFDATMRITHTRGRLAADSQRKYDTALALFEKHVDGARLLELLDLTRADVVTPLMFEFELIHRARSHRKHIVLPEGDDDRILRAAATLLSRDVVDLTILGEPFEVRARAIELGLDISAANVLSSYDDVLRLKFADEYVRLRALDQAATTRDEALDLVTDVAYFGTMMVHLGLADGMVSGATRSTPHTLQPGLEILKTNDDVSVVSSVFFMALADRVLVYGDCAVIADPTSDELADIAISSSETARQFGLEPRVAMLSYTGISGPGIDRDKVREAAELVRERQPNLAVVGPIQYDAAADTTVAASTMPDSDAAGRATVFIFPDLHTGINTYKAVQRSAGAVVIGPVYQGFSKPVNALPRGASIDDIVNTVAITAIQAQATPSAG